MPLQPSETLIVLEKVGLSYNERVVLHGIDFVVSQGDFVVITGPNGGGKTSMLRIMLRLLPPTMGRVRYYRGGQEVEQLKIGYLPQKNAIDSRFPITVSEVVASGLYSSGLRRGKLSGAWQLRVEETLGLLGIEELASRPIGALSGGQLQRALLGRAIISRPELLVLDEPLSYIDEAFGVRIYSILEHLSHETTIVMVTHRPAKVSTMATQMLYVDHGQFGLWGGQ